MATPAIAFRPLAGYFANPDNLSDVRGKRRPQSGFEVDFFIVISLGRLFGTCTKPF